MSEPAPVPPRPSRPAIKSLILCDTIIHEQGTNKKSCIGIFHNITAQSFPCTHQNLALYANLAEAWGEYRITVRIEYLDGGLEIARADLPPLRAPDRLAPTEICVQLQGLPFPRPGKYEVQLLVNGEVIGTRDFRVIQGGPGPRPPASGTGIPDSWPPSA